MNFLNIKIKRLIKLFLFIGLYIENVYTICDWPSEFQNTQWHDSSRGVLTFQTTSMDGWEFSPTTSTTVNTWNCSSSSSYATDGRLILITAQSFQLFSQSYYAYLCIHVSQVTDYSYRYYIQHERQGNLHNERIFLYPLQLLTDANTICSSNGASESEYQFLVQVGFEAQTKVDCPWSMLGSFRYVHTSSSGQTTCNAMTSQLTTCTNTQEMTCDYSMCSTKVTYSVSNTVWCVDNVPVGDSNYVMLFNGNDADNDIDDATVYRYTCMAVSGTMDTASVSPQYCQHGQVDDAFPVSTGGQSTGAVLTFTSQTASCPTCPVLSAPDNGVVDISTNGQVTTALYTCDTSYTLWGTQARVCNSADQWTESAPACSCAPPVTPINGSVAVNEDGSVATYTCDTGFTLSGMSVRNCISSTATWESSNPTCTQCTSFTSLAGQALTLSSTGTVTSASFICGAGFTLDGSQSLTCFSDGSWNASQPNCVNCEYLTNPASGTLVLLSSGTVSTANYACATGYLLQGDSVRTCQLDGTWDKSAPTCACNKPGTPSNGAVNADGTTATYTCDVGYSLNGDSTRSCQTDGSGWSGSNPSCSQCNSLPTVTGGGYTMSTTGILTSARYTCNVGYSLDGVSTITCLNDGTWGSAIPTCVLCETLTNPTSGTVTLSTSGTKTSATYACAFDYDLNGNTIRLCNSDGSWSLVEPTCTCKSPLSPQNGNVTANGVTATYQCNQGYTLNGPATRTCGTDGSGWSGANPTCSTCATLTSPTGGTVNIYSDGTNTQASFTCNSGYTLNGVSPITCRNDGSWDFTAPTCAHCPTVNAPASGSMTMSTDGVETTVTFSCQPGYYLHGDFTITCRTDGTWSNTTITTCKCNFPDTPQYGSVSVSDTSIGPTATYSCINGYSLSGPSSRVCLTDGTGWEGSEPQCVACQTVINPSFGTFNLDSNSTHTTVTFSCNVGSTMNGDREQLCRSDGTWESVAPTCVSCDTSFEIDSGAVTYSSSGSTTTATFTCATGYTLSTSLSTLTCLTTGLWDLSAPYCICESPPLIANGQLTITDNLSTARYECLTGFVMIGNDTRYCQNDGSGWSGITPTCSNTPNTGASTDGDDSSWSVHIAIVIVAIVLLLCLIIALALFIHLYLRLRQNQSRVSSAVTRVSKTPDNPDIMEEYLPNGSITDNDDVNGKPVIFNKYQNDLLRPSSSVKFAKDVTPIPLKPRMTSTMNIKPKPHLLPPLETRMRPKKAKKPAVHLSPIRTPSGRIGVERPQTPLKDRIRDFGIDRVRTPELLSTAEFNYLQPVYPYELDTPPESTLIKPLTKKSKTHKSKRQGADDDVHL